jgi:peptide-methionine (S)-S-oxide reductase
LQEAVSGAWSRRSIGLPGVISTTSGYTGGRTKNPTYEEASSGVTGHTEAVEVVYDPTKITYAQLLDVFWKNIDPITPNRQFCDIGTQYRSAIYYHNQEQRRLAEASKKALETTEIGATRCSQFRAVETCLGIRR